MNYIILILLIYLIFRDTFKEDINNFLMRRAEKEETQEQKEFKKEFDKMMHYSVEDAIKSKRGGIDD